MQRCLPQFEALLRGITDFSNDDTITFRKTDCSGAQLLGGAPALALNGTNRSATLTPAEAQGTVAVCLTRPGVGIAQIGSPFAVASLGYALTPTEAAQDIAVEVAVSGIATFDDADIVSLRDGSCAVCALQWCSSPFMRQKGFVRRKRRDGRREIVGKVVVFLPLPFTAGGRLAVGDQPTAKGDPAGACCSGFCGSNYDS